MVFSLGGQLPVYACGADVLGRPAAKYRLRTRRGRRIREAIFEKHRELGTTTAGMEKFPLDLAHILGAVLDAGRTGPVGKADKGTGAGEFEEQVARPCLRQIK